MRWHGLILPALLAASGASAAEELPSEAGPGEALGLFLEAAHQGDFEVAAAWLTPLAPQADPKEQVRLARRLMFVLDQHLEVEPSSLKPPDPAAELVRVGELPLGRLKVPVELVRHPGTPPWRFSARTVRNVDALFGEHGSPLWDLLPPGLVTRGFWVLGHWQWLGLALLLALAGLVSRLFVAVATPVLRRLARLTETKLDDQLTTELAGPVRAVMFFLLVVAGIRWLAFPPSAQSLVDHLAASGGVAALVWGLLRTSRLVGDAIAERAAERHDVLAQRAMATQVAVLRRVVDAVILVVGGALVLLQFPAVRSIGMSLLASAGVAGVVLGLAAQRSISNLLAGIQISLTQPIRIGDTVIVEGEWGWIEELTLTYVVVKVWDLRRLIVPIGYFLERPFQNWTRGSAKILGTVEVHADFAVDVDAARAELARLVEGERGRLWNGEAQGIQVTAATERAMTLRALVSSDDAGKCWDLRCLVREKLIAWLARQSPSRLPRLRAEDLEGRPATRLEA